MTIDSSSRTRRGRTRAVLAGAVALAVTAVGLGSGSAPAGAATRTVCAVGCDFTSIAAATAAAVNGDVITVAAGTYHEPRIVISQKGITLQGAGAGQTIIDGELRNDLVGGEGQIRVETAALASGPITIKGLTIRNAPKTAAGSTRYAVQIKASRPDPSAVTFDDVDIEGVGNADYGMYVAGTAGVAEAPFTFKNGSITGTAYHGILFENWRRAVTVEDSTFTEPTGGASTLIGFNSDARAERIAETYAFRRNTFTGTAITLYRFSNANQGFDSVEVTDNTFSGLVGTDTAVNIGAATTPGPGTAGFPTAVTVTGNTVSGTGASTRGLAIGSSSDAPVGTVDATGNSFAGIGTGVAVTGSAHGGNVDVRGSRFRSTVGVSTVVPVDAEDSWWGCNAGPGSSGCATTTGTVDSDPRLVVTAGLSSATVGSKGTATVTADLRHLSNGIVVSELSAVFTGLETGYSAAKGSVAPSSGGLASGHAPNGTYTAPTGPTTDTVTVTVDGFAQTLPVQVGGSGIRGTVTSSETGDPISGLQVRLYKDGSTGSAAATTAADGTYSFGNLTTGSYELWYRDISSTQWVSEYHDDAATRAAGTPIAFTTGQVLIADEELAPKPPVIPVTFRSIEGTVTDPEGHPIPGIQVRLYAAPYTGGSAATTTDATGHYEFARRTAGQYKLWFRDVGGTTWVSTYDGDASTLDEADGVTLTDQANLTVNASLDPRPTSPGGPTTGKLAGRVTDANQNPIAGIQVRLYIEGGTGSAATTTDANGEFTFDGRAPGFYRVWFRDLSGQWISEYFDNSSSLGSSHVIPITAGGWTDIYANLSPRNPGA